MSDYTEAAKEVQELVNEMVDGEWGERFGDKVFISSVFEEINVKMNLDTFKTILVELNRMGLIRLSRCDMAYAFNRETVLKSETKHMSSTFHFISAK